MTEPLFDFTITFLESELQIPESYWGVIVDKKDIGIMSERKEVIFPSNIRNAELTNITQIQVEPLPEPEALVYDKKQKDALLNLIRLNNIVGVKKIFEQLKNKPSEYYFVFVTVLEFIIIMQRAVSDEMIETIFAQEDIPLDSYLPNDLSPLESAIISKNKRLIKKLVEKGANINSKHAYEKYKNWSPLIFAIHFFPEIIDYLLEHGANIHYKLPQTGRITGKPIEIEVIAYCFPKLLKDNDIGTLLDLLEAGADVNARDADGATLLMRAAEAGNYTVIRMLVDKGAEIELRLPDFYIQQMDAYNIYKTANPETDPKEDSIISNLLRPIKKT